MINFGVCAYGIELPIITNDSDLVGEIFKKLVELDATDMLHNNDIVAITESVVARNQNNYVTVDEVAEEFKRVLDLKHDDIVHIIGPIASRNRFSLILKSIVKCIPNGWVIFYFTNEGFDEVGNVVAGIHPITGINYEKFYTSIVESAGAECEILYGWEEFYYSNDDKYINALIHERAQFNEQFSRYELHHYCDLTSICNTKSEWGLLGSNMVSEDRLKLAPRFGNDWCNSLQDMILEVLGKKVEIMIYGDGAYKDPTTGIYELADPTTTFGMTDGLKTMRTGTKLKYQIDCSDLENLSNHSVTAFKIKTKSNTELGTTPRKINDLVATLADLISGSADAGTPMVLIKNFIKGDAECL